MKFSLSCSWFYNKEPTLQQVKILGVPRAPKVPGFVTKNLGGLKVLTHMLGTSKLPACIL